MRHFFKRRWQPRQQLFVLSLRADIDNNNALRWFLSFDALSLSLCFCLILSLVFSFTVVLSLRAVLFVLVAVASRIVRVILT